MMRWCFLLSLCFLLGACAQVPVLERFARTAEPEVEVADVEADAEAPTRPVLRPEQETESATPQSGALGTTVVSLGTPAEPGLWLKTPLVSTERAGRVTTACGANVAVTLKPIDGPATAGSRLSLQAMQQLGLPLTDLSEVTVSLD